MLRYRCDICHHATDTPGISRTLANKQDSFDICKDCLIHQRKVGIFWQPLDVNRSFKCDNCGEAVAGRHSAINTSLIFCSSCLSPDLTIEEVNARVNEILLKHNADATHLNDPIRGPA